jgi:FlaA1/EpsC-like NDP-sugar epimerase
MDTSQIYRNFDVEVLSRFLLSHQRNLTQTSFSESKDDMSQNYENSTILIIGASGFIATETIYSLIPIRPKKIFLLDSNENSLTELIRDLRSSISGHDLPELVPILGDITDKVIIQLSSFLKNVDYIFNFAASKHVRSERNIFSLWRMLDTNINGINNVVQLALDLNAKVFSISSDKASNPTNFMGFSKRIMELVLFSKLPNMSYSTRFANVLFSTGSITESWLTRIKNIQPIPVPKDTSRFFISPKEAGQLCLLAPILLQPSNILIPNLNSSDSIELENLLISLMQRLNLRFTFVESDEEAFNLISKFEKENIFPIILSKRDTSGEKAFEEFHSLFEVPKDINPNLRSIHFSSSKYDDLALSNFLSLLKNISESNLTLPSLPEFINLSKRVVPEFNPFVSHLSLDDRL